MNQQYYDGTVKLEKMGVDPDYILGWQGGFLGNPQRARDVRQRRRT